MSTITKKDLSIFRGTYRECMDQTTEDMRIYLAWDTQELFVGNSYGEKVQYGVSKSLYKKIDEAVFERMVALEKHVNTKIEKDIRTSIDNLRDEIISEIFETLKIKVSEEVNSKVRSGLLTVNQRIDNLNYQNIEIKKSLNNVDEKIDSVDKNLQSNIKIIEKDILDSKKDIRTLNTYAAKIDSKVTMNLSQITKDFINSLDILEKNFNDKLKLEISILTNTDIDNINTVSETISELELKIRNTKDELTNNIEEKYSELKEENEKVINTELSKINVKLENDSNKIKNLENKDISTDTKISELEVDLNKKIENLKKDLDLATGSSVEGLGGLNERLTTNEENIKNLQEKDKEIDTKLLEIDTLKSNDETTNSNIELVKKDISSLTENINNLNTASTDHDTAIRTNTLNIKSINESLIHLGDTSSLKKNIETNTTDIKNLKLTVSKNSEAISNIFDTLSENDDRLSSVENSIKNNSDNISNITKRVEALESGNIGGKTELIYLTGAEMISNDFSSILNNNFIVIFCTENAPSGGPQYKKGQLYYYGNGKINALAGSGAIEKEIVLAEIYDILINNWPTNTTYEVSNNKYENISVSAKLKGAISNPNAVGSVTLTFDGSNKTLSIEEIKDDENNILHKAITSGEFEIDCSVAKTYNLSFKVSSATDTEYSDYKILNNGSKLETSTTSRNVIFYYPHLIYLNETEVSRTRNLLKEKTYETISAGDSLTFYVPSTSTLDYYYLTGLSFGKLDFSEVENDKDVDINGVNVKYNVYKINFASAATNLVVGVGTN